ncbi:hypothetical protein [Actinoplanes flavus]|uniref:Uncharacterized protein n=1 Tax=Actinoplanes flavus TaxID=2820290 RepID=A0ABS3UCS9_9ACTN|nr:hypothetical protein [Actinoplanes flavus]MBO3736581.1 hypothetical protein [Actinoplanes flavus]
MLLILAGATAAQHPSTAAQHGSTDILLTVQTMGEYATALHQRSTDGGSSHGHANPGFRLAHPCPQSVAPPQPGWTAPSLTLATVGVVSQGEGIPADCTAGTGVPRDVLLLTSVSRI